MKKNIIIIAISVFVFAVIGSIGYYVFLGSSGKLVSAAPGEKLADQSYAKSAYLVSSDTISPEAQRALAGFTVQKKTASDGGMDITLKATASGYSDMSYHLQKGQQLYFIDTDLNDDINGHEYGMYDDRAVVVDANGYIIQ